MHEHAEVDNAPIRSSSDRAFGLVFAAVFLILALYPPASGQAARLWAMAIGVAFLGLALIIPKALAPANRVWTKFGRLLNAVVSPFALGILFYLVVTPTGLLMRLFGKDPLRLAFDPAARTYWVSRDPPGPNAESLTRQF